MDKNIADKYPVFYKTSDYLENKANFFRISIPRLIKSDFNFELAENICKTGLELSANKWEEYFEHVSELVNMSYEFLKLQIKLEKDGKYLYSSFKEVEENAYSNNGKSEGPSYLWALYFSEVFWKIHHNFTNFFLKDFINTDKENGAVLEIPLGSGFFLSEFLEKNKKWFGVGVDMADTAIDFSKKLFNLKHIPEYSYKILKIDFHNFPENEKYDRIICGEFLEHLEDPLEILKKIHRILTDDGKVFITVAVWAAHIDHIYLYKSANEVRNHLHQANFCIEKELVQSVFEKDEMNPEKEKIPVNYAAILKKI